MQRLSVKSLQKLSTRILAAAGASEDEAAIISKSLVASNLLGHDSHGVIRVEQYVRAIRSGSVNLGTEMEIFKETPTTLMVEGNWNFGQVIARRSMEKAIEKAQQSGLVQLTVSGCYHIGRLGEYTQMAAEQGLVALLMANGCGGANVAPFGGYGPRVATNPISFAAPWKDAFFLLDMTTSVAPEGKVRVRLNRGEALPEGWIVDSEGNKSTDPNDLYGPPAGALLPLGGMMGHKGTALALMIEIMGGILSRAGAARPGEKRIGNGIYAILVKIEDLIPREEFDRQLDETLNHIKSSPTLPGFEEILVPGEPEFRQKAIREKEGIPIEDETWRQLVELAKELGVVDGEW